MKDEEGVFLAFLAFLKSRIDAYLVKVDLLLRLGGNLGNR